MLAFMLGMSEVVKYFNKNFVNYLCYGSQHRVMSLWFPATFISSVAKVFRFKKVEKDETI